MDRKSEAQIRKETHREVVRIIDKEKFILLIRGDSIASVVEATDLAHAEGFGLTGWDFQAPEVRDLMKSLKKEKRQNSGVFNVPSAKDTRLAVNRGARFMLLTHLDGGAIKKCRAESVFHAPGALTPNEVAECNERRAECVSLFPCGAMGGAAWLKFVKGTFPKIKFIPTDVMTPAESLEYLRAGAYAAAPIIDAKDAPEFIRELAKIKNSLEK